MAEYQYLDEDSMYSYIGFRFDLCHYGFGCIDKIECETVEDQILTEENCVTQMLKVPEAEKNVLEREKHADYLRTFLNGLSHNFISLEGSRSWIVFWCVNGLRILKQNIDKTMEANIITFLNTCQKDTGGFGGSPMHMAHLATTYASVMALVSLGTDEALSIINREALYDFILSMKQPNGSFIMHEGGEVDIRGVYCAVAVAAMTQIIDDELFEGTAAWVVSCQTYEGGFAAEPFVEAHGGYTYCGVAALALLKKLPMANYERLLDWSSQRQMSFEGGFQGRANKLVDACYSFWMAAIFPILDYEMKSVDNKRYNYGAIFDSEALESYLLTLCQNREKGGLRDKPGKQPDAYHTCYGLAGLAIAQHYSLIERETILGGEDNLLAQVNPLYNVVGYYHETASGYFESLRTRSLEKAYFQVNSDEETKSTSMSLSQQDKEAVSVSGGSSPNKSKDSDHSMKDISFTEDPQTESNSEEASQQNEGNVKPSDEEMVTRSI